VSQDPRDFYTTPPLVPPPHVRKTMPAVARHEATTHKNVHDVNRPTPATNTGSAIISADEQFRYELRRKLNPITAPEYVRRIVFMLFNPSTAAAHIDDHTSRKGIGFSDVLGGTEMVFLNPYAFRCVDPTVLWKVKDPIGPENDAHILRVLLSMTKEDVLIFGWGGLVGPKMADRIETIACMVYDLAELPKRGIEPMCLGTTKYGAPRHPLMLSYKTKLEPYGLDRIKTGTARYK
jgi:hypothetical protein